MYPRFGVGTVWRESVQAMAGTVYRLCARRSADARPGRTGESVSWGGCEGRHMAGAYGSGTGYGAKHGRRGWTRSYFAHTRCGGGCRRGGVAGAEPPHKGGPNRPDRPELQWSVVSGQWSVTALFVAETGMGTDLGLVACGGMRLLNPHFGMYPSPKGNCFSGQFP